MVLQLCDKPRFPYGGVGPVGLHASHRLSERGGRSEGLARTSEEAAALLGGKRDAREGLRGHERDAYVEALQRAPWVVDALAALAKGKRPVS
jgi:hypothetical protein